MLDGSIRWTAYRELATLRKVAERTGEDLRELVAVPPKVRAQFEAFMAENPGDPVTLEIRQSLQIRDWMLDRLEPSRVTHDHDLDETGTIRQAVSGGHVQPRKVA